MQAAAASATGGAKAAAPKKDKEAKPADQAKLIELEGAEKVGYLKYDATWRIDRLIYVDCRLLIFVRCRILPCSLNDIFFRFMIR